MARTSHDHRYWAAGVLRPPALAVGAGQQREPQPDRAGVLPERCGDHHRSHYLATVAAEINDRPRKIHDWKKPTEVFAELLEADASTG